MNLLQANGAGAGQSVPHLHIHIMPRRPNDGVVLNWEPKPGDKAEIEAIYRRLKAALRRQGGAQAAAIAARGACVSREPLALVLAELFAHVVDHGADAGALVGLLVRHQPDIADDVEVDRRLDQVRRSCCCSSGRPRVPHDAFTASIAECEELVRSTTLELRSTTSLHGFIAGRLCSVVWSTMWCSRRSSSSCGRPYCSM